MDLQACQDIYHLRRDVQNHSMTEPLCIKTYSTLEVR